MKCIVKCPSLILFFVFFSIAVSSWAMETAVIQPGFFAAEKQRDFLLARDYSTRGALQNLQAMYRQDRIFALPEKVAVEIVTFDSGTLTCRIGLPQSGIYYWTDIEAVKPGYRSRTNTPQANSEEQIYTLRQGFFRIKYYLGGEHAVSAEDTNKNGIPDYVDDVAIQLHVAHHVFCKISGFSSPLQSARYPGLVYVDVCIYNRSKLNNNNGIAFSAMQSAKDPDNPAARAIVIYLAADIDPKKNLTPTHEYFHQIQNGMSQFKNGWYYEGMARWSEDALGKREQKVSNREDLVGMLENTAELAKLFAMSYDVAQKLWMPLANLSPDTSLPLSTDDPILNLRYSDGTKVMQDQSFAGARFMCAVLDGLAAIEKVPFTTHNYGQWTEENRRDKNNNLFILQAIRQAMDNRYVTYR